MSKSAVTIFSKDPVNGSMGNIAFQKCPLIVILALIFLVMECGIYK